jgi:hypothetical protein
MKLEKQTSSFLTPFRQPFTNITKKSLNFFNNHSTNVSAESFNAKIKAFRAALRGVADLKFSCSD